MNKYRVAWYRLNSPMLFFYFQDFNTEKSNAELYAEVIIIMFE
jgi:hypothetical protein